MAEDLNRFVCAIERHLGHRLDDRSAAMMEILERRASRGHESMASYLEHVESGDPVELRALACDIAVGETHFFRHAEQVQAFGDLLPGILGARGHVRVLSAGCATGEEPYTLAIVARERLPSHVSLSIDALDFNTQALASARRARYSRWALRATSVEHERRWFEQDGNELMLAASIREAVSFVEANLVGPRAWEEAGPWDVVFCRNVLMYFAADGASRLVERLVRGLAPGGYLFLGHAESLREHAHELELCHTHGTFYYRRRAVRGSSAPVVPLTTASTLYAGVAPDRAWTTGIGAATRRVHDLVDHALSGAAPSRSSLEPIRTLVREERFIEARDALDALEADGTRSAEVTLLRALVGAQTGDSAAARTACARLLAVEQYGAYAHYLLAICEPEPERSERHAHDALAADPSFAMAGVHLAFLARRRRGRTTAADYLKRAITLLESDRSERLEMFAGGFTRATLIDLCRAELASIGSQ